MFILSAASELAWSQENREVELHAFDGSAVVKGDLIEIADGAYVLQTALGALRIGLDEAECKGAPCPRLDRFDADFAIRATDDETASLINGLLFAYADYLGADHLMTDGQDGDRAFEILDNQSGEQLVAVDLPRLKAADKDHSADELSLVVSQGPTRNAEGQNRLLLALDGAALITHPDGPIDVLNRRAVADLFACTEETPQSVQAAQPKLFVPNLNSESFQTFKATVLDPFELTLCDSVQELASEEEVIAAVARNIDSVGVVGLSQPHNVKSLAIAECGIPHQPSFLNVKAGEYPLVRRILMEAPSLKRSSGAVQRFIEFTQSEAGQERLQALGWVGLNLEAEKSNATEYRTARLEAATKLVQQTQPLYQFMEATAGAMRLSTTFRFDSGNDDMSSQGSLDQRAQRDLSRLVGYLQGNKLSEAELLVFGFADSSGAYDANLALSRQRAQSVADQLATFGVPITAVDGFGEELPIACNENPAGRAKNRRVEVWMRQSASRT